MRNRHIMFITIEHRNLEIRKHVTTSCSGPKPFYYFWVKGFDIRRETQSFYAGFFIWPLSRAAPMACKFVSPQRAPKVDCLRPVSCLNSPNFLLILHKPLRASSAWRHSHSITCFVSDYCDISEWHLRPPARLR